MIYIWNIYEPLDEKDYDENDPFDVFIYALRKEEAPQKNAVLYVEGKNAESLLQQKTIIKMTFWDLGLSVTIKWA